MIQKFCKAAGAIGLSVFALGLIASFIPKVTASIPVTSTLQPKLVEQPAAGNLLINPDFENGYTRSLPCCNNIAVPIGWNIRWYTDTAIVLDNITYTFKQPEVKLDDNTIWPYCPGCAPNIPARIHTGRYAVDSFVLFAPQDVSLYQQVGDLPIGAVVTGTAWLQAWVSSCNPFPSGGDPLPAISLQGSNGDGCPDNFWPVSSNHMLVGIDPYGGSDPRSPNVVWNWDGNDPAWWGPYDYYSSTLPVVTVAQAHTVTLFLRAITHMPTKYDDVYFDTASLTASFPISLSAAVDQLWPLPITATVSVHTPLTLTGVIVTATDQAANSLPIVYLGSTADASGVLAQWQLTPSVAGRQTFTLTANELVAPLVQPIEVDPLPFEYVQDQLLPPDGVTLTEPVFITYLLSSPITLTNLTTIVTDPIGSAVMITPTGSSVVTEGYEFWGDFAPELAGLYTITFNADEFTQPYERLILAATQHVYLPLLTRNP